MSQNGGSSQGVLLSPTLAPQQMEASQVIWPAPALQGVSPVLWDGPRGNKQPGPPLIATHFPLGLGSGD